MAMECCMVKSKSMTLLAMILLQLIHAVVYLLSKFALNSGMEPYVFVTYKQILATLAIAPLAIILERNTWSRITRHVLFLSLLCSIFGATLHQLALFFGLEHSTPIISVATVNILPALTFIIAVIFRQERVMIREWSGQAKVLGTCVCVGGASMLAFYHGGHLTRFRSTLHLHFTGSKNVSATVFGAVLITLSRVSSAIWLTIQTELSRKYPAPFTNTTLLCLFSSIQCAVISVIIDRRISCWWIKKHIQLVAVLYAGLVSSAVGFLLTSWIAGKEGPLYVSVFGPVSLVVVAILSWALLDEKLYHGTLYGALLIMAGLYMVLWGKSKEQLRPKLQDMSDLAKGTPGELGMPNGVGMDIMSEELEEKGKV